MIEALAPFPILAPGLPVPALVDSSSTSADVGIKRILVGTDGTAPAIASLAWAAALAERTGAEIILANVLDSGQAGFSAEATDAPAIEVEGHLLSDWSSPLRASNVTWSTLVLRGTPMLSSLLRIAKMSTSSWSAHGAMDASISEDSRTTLPTLPVDPSPSSRNSRHMTRSIKSSSVLTGPMAAAQQRVGPPA
jgi:hypothetical protein